MVSTSWTAPPTSQRAQTYGGPVDQAQMRSANMGLILRHLRTYGARSRARLAAETGLAKATMSSLIGELTERGLVAEGTHVRNGSVGRPGLAVTLDGRRACGVGVEINVDYFAVTVVDLTGTVIRQLNTPIAARTLAVEVVLDRVATALSLVLDSVHEAGLMIVSLTVSSPGVIDYGTGSVTFAPNLGWRDVPLVDELRKRLGDGVPPIHLENDSKLAAVAEYARHAVDGIDDLLFLTGDVGVGAGIIAGGRLIRGWSGFSGEVGHLPLASDDRPCNCGRTGCWETVVGLAELLGLVSTADDVVNDPSLPLEDRLAMIHRRADQGDQLTLSAITTITGRLAHGLSILIDVLNPRVIVLGGYFGYLGDYILEPLHAELEQRRMDVGSSVILTSAKLGINAASHGGALVSLEDVFDDPTIVATQ